MSNKLDFEFLPKEVATKLLNSVIEVDGIEDKVRFLKGIDSNTFNPHLLLMIKIPYEEVIKTFPDGMN